MLFGGGFKMRTLNFLFCFLLIQALTSAASAQEVGISSDGRNFLEIEGRVFELIDDMYLEYGGLGPRSVQPIGVRTWPDGVLPVVFDAGYTQADRNAFFNACLLWSNVSRVTCVPRSNEVDYVLVVAGDSNSSFVGRIGGEQRLELFNRQNQGIIAHEIAHALGFAHQHNAPNRDRFVTINWSNIQANARHNFRRVPQAVVFGIYDYCSILHYGLGDFSSNGQNTITLIGSPQINCVPGQRRNISDADAMGMADAYGRDPQDQVFVPVPDFAEMSGAALTNPDWAYSRFGVRTSIVAGENRDECIRHTICETTCYTTRLTSQSPAPGTPIDFGSTVDLTTFVDADFIFYPPPGRQCP
jgi:hypothetical protein